MNIANTRSDAAASVESCFTIYVNDEPFGLRARDAETIFPLSALTPIPLGPPHIAGLANLRGRTVTAVSLRSRFGIPPREGLESLLAIAVEHRGETFALIVDRVGDVRVLDESMRLPMPPHFDASRQQMLAGLYQIDDLLIPMLDVAAVLDFAGQAGS